MTQGERTGQQQQQGGGIGDQFGQQFGRGNSGYGEQNHPMRRATDRVQEGEQIFETTWEQVNAAGAYIEVGTGDLFRIPREAVVTGASPLIQKVSNGRSRLLHVSDDPYVPVLKARSLAANANIQPNF